MKLFQTTVRFLGHNISKWRIIPIDRSIEFASKFPDELKDYYINYNEQNPTVLKTPHITASLAEGAKATNTKNLNFKPLEKPVKLVGRFGYWIKGKSEEHLSYEPYLKCKTR